MLLNLREYFRPATENGDLEAALQLLARPNIRTVLLAGGDTLLASGNPAVEAVVDLQGLGLDVVALSDDGLMLRIGAMVTRTTLATWAREGASLLQAFIAQAAHAWGGSVQRNRATAGGALATAAANDPLVAAFLACDAEVVLYSASGHHAVPLVEFLAQRVALLDAPAIITELRMPVPAAATAYALESVARTPSDAPIVLAAAAVTCVGGHCTVARLALGGVAEMPSRLVECEAVLAGQVVTPALINEVAECAARLAMPCGDFRGSAQYRRAMAGVLAGRAVQRAWKQVG